MPTLDASQWNIGGVGTFGVGAGVGHVHFMFFVLISFAFCSQREPSFQWNMGLPCPPYYIHSLISLKYIFSLLRTVIFKMV